MRGLGILLFSLGGGSAVAGIMMMNVGGFCFSCDPEVELYKHVIGGDRFFIRFVFFLWGL